MALLQKALINPPEPCGWMDALFWASHPPFTAIIKLGRAMTFF